MSKSKRSDLKDKFYTREVVAKELLNELDFNEFEYIIEPSAGKGSFSNNIEDCIAIDIDPRSEGIEEMDFFEFTFSEPREKTLVVGNPPFGRQGSKALEFIKKASEIADTIAFILPKSFKKPSMKKKVPSNYHLVKEIDLESDIFLYEGSSYNVPCVFQVWKNKYFKRKKQNKVDPVGFLYVDKEDNPDVAVRRVGVYAGEFYLETEEKSRESHYFLRIIADLPLEEVVNISSSDFEQVDHTTGPNSISKSELNRVINGYLKERGLIRDPEFW